MTSKSKEKLNQFSLYISLATVIVSIALFWFGMSFLKTEVFPHYYNPDKHVIVNQNHDTKEIYAWKDANNVVYTPEDNQVKNFTWGTTALLLLVMVIATTGYNLSIKFYTKSLLQRERSLRQNYSPTMQ